MSRSSINRLRRAGEVLIMCAADIVLLLALFWVSLYIRTHILPLVYAGFPSDPPFRNYYNLIWLLAVWVFFFHYEGLYTKRFSFWDEIEVLLKASFLSTAGVFIIISIGRMGPEISRTLVVFMGAITFLVLPIVRILLKRLLRKAGILRRRVLILGASDAGRRIAQALKNEPNYGYVVIGFIDDDPEMTSRCIGDLKVHRGLDRVLVYIARSKITDVIIALPDAEKERARGLINELQHKVERVLFVPDMLGVVAVETSLVHFFHEQVFAFEIQNNLSRPFNIFLKRAFDLVVCSIILVFLFLPLLIIAVFIKLDSKGPVFFKHARVGRNGGSFGCFKFRTMYADAAKRLEELLSRDVAAREEWEAVFKLKNDPRVTRVGKFLRSMSLDELPQLVNVIRGEMSLVGPRPVIQEEIDKYYKGMAGICFSVRPGVTGLWQVSGRNDTSYDYRIAFDMWYVKNWNLWLDIVIIFKTVRAVLKREGAY